MSQFPETDVYDRACNLGVPADEFVLAGGSAIEVAVGPEVRRAEDVSIAVSEETYRQLRNRSDLTEAVLPNGCRQLTGNGYNIAAGYGGRSIDELKERGYQHNGVHITGLPDIYQATQERGLPKDSEDLQIIRDRLYGDLPMPTAMLQNELHFVKGSVPERLSDRPELIVAANGLLIVRTVFGHEQEGVRTYTGSFEEGEVPATYHAWEHSALGARDGQRNIDIVEADRATKGLPPKYSDDERIAALAGFANHDTILGHGRRAANPTGHDELQSADLVARHLQAVGAPEVVQEAAHAGVMATTFNEAKKAQDVDPLRGYVPVQELCAGSDMSTFRRPGVDSAVALTVEDLSRKGADYDQPLLRLIDQLNSNLPEGAEPVRVRTTEEGLALIDAYPDFLVVKNTPEGPQHMTLRQAYTSHLRGSEWFAGNYKFPDSWQLGDPEVQKASAVAMGELAGKVERGNLSAVDSYAAAQPQAVCETVIYDSSRSTESRETAQTRGGGIAEVRAAIHETISLLPTNEMEVAIPHLEEAQAQLVAALEGTSNNQHAIGATETLAVAIDLLQRLRQTLHVAADELSQYNRDLG